MLEHICKCLIDLFSNRKIIQWLFFIQILCMKSLSAMLFQPSVSIFCSQSACAAYCNPNAISQYPHLLWGRNEHNRGNTGKARQLVEFLALLQQHFEFSAQTSKLNLTRSNSFSADHISREREIERELKENIQIILLQPHHSEWDVSDKPNHIENPIQINSLRISLENLNMKPPW